jgi:tRNA nucleotidyltransferase (CCA-adding enzyme)
MVVRRTTYPQVEPRARDLMVRAIAVVPPSLAFGEARRLARHCRARLLLARRAAGWGGVTAAVVERALALGLERVAVAAALWDAPVVAAATPEVTVRRTLGPGTPFAVVLEGETPVGALLREPGMGGALPRSAAAALHRLDPDSLEILRAAGRLGEERGWPVAVVGGLVRDLLLGRPAAPLRDLDVAVEGDGRALARHLARALGGEAREHPAFLTATVTLADGRRVDVATARQERYRAPGALPVVEPASLQEDLARRDFSVNALAVRLDGAAWGAVLDPAGGLRDLAGRRLRVLHPLSFIEDPTRAFRAARFAERLGLRLAPTTGRLLTAAAALPVYGPLSGERLMAELEAILAEPAPAAVLGRLGRLGAFRICLPAYRYPREAASRLAEAAAAAAALPLAPDTVAGLYLLALSGHLATGAAEAWVARWGARAPLREAIARAHAEAPRVAGRLEAAGGSAAAYGVLRDVGELTAAWAWVVAERPGARRWIGAHLGRWRVLPPLLTGGDLKALGLAPGPRFGRLLAELRVAQIAGRLHTREDAVGWVRRALAVDAGSGTANGSSPDSKGG